MSSTDDRIVRMQFDNESFKKGAIDTQKSLADLNKSVDAAGKNTGLLNMNEQMGQVSVTASKMAIITTTALATIANKVTNTAIQMAGALTFEPIKQGFLEYESLLTKQNVIMNATGKSASEVKGYLNQLNHYSDQTIYSFSNMTDSITKFVNAGVPLPRSVTSIKGIANAAAYAGATTNEANRAMYAFSQSMQTGFIMLNDWMQIENANMGTIQFKETLLDAGVAAGTLTKQGKMFITSTGRAISATKGWRDGLQDQWATTEVLNDALGQYADKSTALGKKAFESATQVRTFTAFMDTLKESLGSGWSAVFTALVGNLKQATTFWTGLSNAVGGSVKNFFSFISTAISTWRKMGGFEKTIQTITNLMAPFKAILKAVGDAWRAAFPDSDKGAGKALYGLSAAAEAVTSPLRVLAGLIEGTTPVLKTFFQILGIGWTVLKNGVGFVKDFVESLLGLVDMPSPKAGGFIGFVMDIANEVKDAVNQVSKLIQKGKSLTEAFGSVDFKLPEMPGLPSMGDMSMDGAVTSRFGGLVKNMTALVSGTDDLGDAAQKVEDSALFNPDSEIEGRFSQLKDGMSSAAGDAQSFAAKIGDAFSWLWDKFSAFVEGISKEDIVSAFNLALLTTVSVSISKFMLTLSKSFEGFMGIGEGLNEVMTGAGSALKSFQTQANAKLLLNLGIAIALLAASMWLLSTIPAKKLLNAIGGMTAIVVLMNMGLKGMASAVEKMDGKGVNLKLIALSIAVLALAGAMILLGAAFLIMDHVDMDGIIKGLGTMIITMKVLEQFGNLGENAAKNLAGAALAITAVAVSMVILAGALLLFKLVDWESMGKAGAALAGITLAVGLLALIPYEGIAKVGLALLAASVGMIAIAGALVIFALVEWESIGKAAVVLAALTISLALLMAVGGPAAAGAMLGLAGAFVLLALGCLMLNKVDWASIGKAALVLTVLLAALAVGAVIITVFLYAIAPLSPIILILAAAMIAFGLAVALFSAAMAAAMALAAGGTAAFAALATGAAVAIAVFLQTLAAEAPLMKESFLKILQSLIDTIVEAVPMIIDGIQRLWEAVKKQFSDDGKKKDMKNSGMSLMDKVKEGIKTMMPKIVEAAKDLVVGMLRGLADKAPDLLTAGLYLLGKLLEGISRRIPEIVDAAVNIIIKFATALKDGLVDIVNAGVSLIADFLHDLADAIRGGSSQIASGLKDVIDAMKDVGVDMIKGLIEGVGSMASEGIGAIGDLASSMIDAAKDKFKIFSPSRVFRDIGKFVVHGLTKGIQDNAAAAIVAVASMVQGQIAIAQDLVSKYVQRLDQQATAARARADGLAKAAQVAQKQADKAAAAAAKTEKNKEDDKAAKQQQKAADELSKQAKEADKKADKADAKVRKQKAKEARQERWKEADSFERAKIRGQQAEQQLRAAKEAERRAEAARVEANALDRQAQKEGLSKQDRKDLRKQADKLRQDARNAAQDANKHLKNAKDAAADSLVWQKKAGAEAAEAFQKQFEREAQQAADQQAFDALSNEEKAAIRRKEAEDLQAKAEKDLERAKKLAKTDLERANQLAQIALDEAERARQYLEEAQNLEQQGSTETNSGQVIDLQMTDAAALAVNQYSDLYNSAYAAAAGQPTVEFNQYNTSPESLDDATIYRQTNNLFTFAADKITNPTP